MLFALLGQQIVLCDAELFHVGIAGKLDYLHPVKQRSGDGRCSVRRCDEKHIGKIIRHFKEVVPEGFVLLGGERFQKRRRRVATVVRAELVNLVKHHQGV